MEKERILVVDDEPIIRTLVKRVIKSLGYQIDSASNAASAIEMMSQKRYVSVISDIKMPGKDGIWFLKEIKKRYPDTQVIMLTASDSLENAIASLNFGAESYLLKPLNIYELSHVIEKTVEKMRLIIRDREHKIWMKEKLKTQKNKIEEIFIGSTKALAASLEAKDKYTEGHSKRVTEFSTSFSEFIGMNKSFLKKIKIAGSLHDIGKIGIRGVVLNKAGKLTKREYDHVKKHSVLGEQIVAQIIKDRDIRLSIRHHHERYDGKGYPDGLKGDKISLGARILALADSFDAMTSHRPYRKACDKKEAMKRIKENVGTQFDPELAKDFLKMIKKQKI